MIKKLLNFFANGIFKAEELEPIRPKLWAANRRSLTLFAALSAAATASGTLGGLFTDIAVMRQCFKGYLIVFLLNISVIVINNLIKRPSKKLQAILISLFVAPLYIFALYQAVFISPEDRPLILVVFLCLIPTIFIDAPARLFIDFGATAILFTVLGTTMVPEEQIGISVADVLIFGAAGVGIGLFFNKSRTERYLLSHRIQEMQNESEQMKYWKSISNIYLSMNQINLENDTFIQIRSHELVDAALKNNHEGYSKQIADVVKSAVDPDYVEAVMAFVDPSTLQTRLEDEDTITYEFLGKNYGWCRARYIVVDRRRDESIKQVMFLIESINEQKKREKELTAIAETDGMTGLYNRRAGIPKIKKLMGLKTPGMLCLLDVDKFKHINDTYGHQAGDRVIIAVADTLKATFRDVDIILRLGGDEFVFFISNVDSERIATNVFNRLFDRFEKVSIGCIPDYSISVSIGATFTKEGLSFDDLYSQADSCTYESKKVNGKAFTFYRG
ncbi:GGDEF domain-containing protein [Fibrobacter sp. UWEL]|uniref:sensor domain-containing diguanylate cyclase n=1 Tax=Fibrobacter sp. UWEL TaxID=1896209 RepID=UPI0009129EC0|nr:GGDEF domain-containing protein [Fibrobacter sp. UWEL]SHL42473.1 diguanylate cyclase (GGDEF) domain-containing protein [Fibrobacter sp. UWEL]